MKWNAATDLSGAARPGREARPGMHIDTFNTDTGAMFDRQLWNELCSLRFLDDARGALILGPVGVGIISTVSASVTTSPTCGQLPDMLQSTGRFVRRPKNINL